jgi:hypothetical protein
MSHTLLQCQYSVIRWLIAFTIQLKSRSRNFNDRTELETTAAGGSISVETFGSKEDVIGSTSTTSSNYPGVNSSLRQLGNLCQAADIVRSVLYSTPDNVLTVYEIFRQVSYVDMQYIM